MTGKEKKEQKEKRKGPVMSSWKKRRIIAYGCWGLLAVSFAFAVYKNFTAIDRETVYEKKTVVERVENYSGIESFTENFARLYFSYSTDSEEQMKWKSELEDYMQKPLLDMNAGSRELLNTVTVSKVQLWSVKPLTEANTDFRVVYTVTQETKNIEETSAWMMDVHTENGSYVVTKNPAVTNMPGKSGYETERLKASDSLETEDREKIQEFLNTFYKIYPKATEKELVYYVKDKSVKPIGKDYKLESIDNLTIQKTGKGEYTVSCSVKYLDNILGMSVLNQYELKLASQEDGELIIMEMR